MKKKNEKCLHACESIIDADEYKKMVKYFPEIYWAYVIWGSFFNLFLSAIIAIISRSLLGTLVFLIIYQIFIMILYKARLEHYAEKSFLTEQKNNPGSTNIYTEFYDDYFVRIDETLSRKIKYTDIERVVETNTNFYLYYKSQKLIVFIQKNRCDLETVNFIRKKFNNLESHLVEDAKFKGVKKYSHPTVIKVTMIWLFILTILSIWGALGSVALLDEINPQHGFNFTKNLWVFWCWLPIPLLSIVLGYKFRQAGFKCTKNIVSGFIIGFLLLIYGSFCLFPTFEEDYTKINDYKNIVDVDLPSNGELEIQNWDTYFEEDKTDYSIINAYYDKEDVNALVKSIEKNENWILSQEIRSELKIFIPFQLTADDDAYFSIYNKTLDTYNTMPDKSEKYEIYAMKYDKSDKQLEIHNFKYNYN